ncbi:MAG: heme/hemin ABC transporter substrate-binding protein [Pelagimonas sp.]|uniref:heme/hemin ABC transporter substrate-binding protein n=1 Tax=Pelagimonas sp. TaxID=2073170 RepID=UPI003D6B46B5
MIRRDFLTSGLALICAGISASGTLPVWAEQASDTVKVAPDTLAIGGTVTEIVFALGQGHRLLARDTTSNFPPEAQNLPDVGYMRALSPEGVLSVGPTMIIAEEGAGPPETLDVLRAANVSYVDVPLGYDLAAIVQKIRIVGAALGVSERAEKLAQDVSRRFDVAVAAAQAKSSRPKRVMFLLSAQQGKLLVGGEQTAADAIIRLSGGVNAVQGLHGFKPLTDEAAAAAAPDVVLMMSRGGAHDMSAAALFSSPSLMVTPAATTQALVKMDGLKLLGFGPRTAEAVNDLSKALGDL